MQLAVNKDDQAIARKTGETVLRNVSGDISYELRQLTEAFCLHRLRATETPTVLLQAEIDRLRKEIVVLQEHIKPPLPNDAYVTRIATGEPS
jgi:hypothetical protein